MHFLQIWLPPSVKQILHMEATNIGTLLSISLCCCYGCDWLFGLTMLI